ncbi:hypothetical protein K9N50_11295 [bacterium]|nr:hypothetical protein [bacterium]
MSESPFRAVIFWVVLIFTIWMVYWNIESIIFTIFAGLLLLGSLSSFYLPTTYIIDSKGAGFRRFIQKRKIEWGRVRSVSDEDNGVFLSPFPVKSRLENFRGIFLPYRGNRAEILELIAEYAPDIFQLNDSELEDDGIDNELDDDVSVEEKL